MAKKFKWLTFFGNPYFWVFFIPFGIYFFICFKHPNFLGFTADDGLYFGTAEALVNGKGYHIPSLPYQPPQTLYPPLYPIILAFFMLLGILSKSNVFRLALPSLIFLSLSGFILYSYTQKRWPGLKPWMGVLLIAIILLHPSFFDFIRFPMAEIPFMFFCLTCLFFLEKSEEKDERKQKKYLLLSGLFAGLAVLTRSIGMVLIMSAILWLLFQKKRFKKILYFSIFSVPPFVSWAIYSRWLVHSSNEILRFELYHYYLGYFSTLPTVINSLHIIIVQNFTFMMISMADLFTFLSIPNLNFWNKPLLTLFFSTLGNVFLWGGLILFYRKKGLKPEMLFLPLYFFLVLIWPFEPYRFLVVLIPWMFLSTLSFVEWAVIKVQKLSWIFVIIGVFCGGLALKGQYGFFQQNVSHFGLFTRTLDLTHTQESLLWMKKNLPNNAIVGAIHPEMLYHHSGRMAVPPLDESSLRMLFYPSSFNLKEIGKISSAQKNFIRKKQKKVWSEWKDLGVTHIWMDKALRFYPRDFALRLQIQTHKKDLRLIYVNPTSQVYIIKEFTLL